MHTVRNHRGHRRRGAALVIALALLVLAGALLTGTHASARVASRIALSRESVLAADARARLDAAQFLGAWDSSAMSLAPGGQRSFVIGPTPVGSAGEITVTKLRLVRLDARRFLLATATQVGPDDAVRARRRASYLLEYPVVIDSSSPSPIPAPAAQWAQHRLY